MIDTKWKRLKEDALRESVSSADMYQMLAYGHRYGAPEVVLLYPHHAGLQHWTGRRATYQVEDSLRRSPDSAIHVVIATIELIDLKLVPFQLRQLFPRSQCFGAT
ncbi:MAG: hypothetical protein CFE44_23635 [Burkholderiales bacterium PBB4]|nr:MAG: hypothetical protein CFE44_23635 [Burkholderiales bacterium PBB4]